ncbi:lymphocyte antigen 6G [Neodiprion pinetum]|uniref:Lymphocyte antigen 6G n=1 Tax=Neodiprion lecontei TaxID=441921 RepID=A0A6J0C8W2_NEOLC|nr:lymphocyte antigen 6G [Neodiprion lecontei]XP_046422135.1 lymphocyte antigen 6G [Neodiprion fabricii]XP_046422136.1 lymphocyte antigen 6G [Neodiprion fabricii]XP_046475584.1 lymphocyte antigen 6G [Neodiprion pinetum]XP_046475585.1 lymphocyte antigen 6G [Neodiprion pinetum]XP_046615513.1 lymphocyte antigen 6G [Neodiprion virginianus]XP_046615515.1 lymphocyte antigen 6G [Neodiprion virginianus]
MSSSVKFYARITILLLCGLCIGTTQGLNCFICGMYNDGVGSITPCLNYTAQMHLNECPTVSSWCIKYVSEGSIVRDCVPECQQKESWSTKTYCCREDGCNSAPGSSSSTSSAIMCALAVFLSLFLQQWSNLRG